MSALQHVSIFSITGDVAVVQWLKFHGAKMAVTLMVQASALKFTF